MKRYLWTILFFGGLWGIAEATAGYVLHLAAIALPGLPGFLMFPIAFFFMHQVFKTTGRPAAAFHIALVAAAIKFTGFFVPGHIPLRIVNPALSIVMEGLAVAAVFAYLAYRQRSLGFVPVLAMGVLWRTAFMLHMVLISRYDLPAALYTDGILVSLRFVLFESFINALVMAGYLRLQQGVRSLTWVSPPTAGAAVMLALVLNVWL